MKWFAHALVVAALCGGCDFAAVQNGGGPVADDAAHQARLASDAPAVPTQPATAPAYEVAEEEFPTELPNLALSVTWPEQKLANNNIHKLRVPRGGTVTLTAAIDPAGVNLGECRIDLVDSAGEVVGLSVNGEAREPAGSLELEIQEPANVAWKIRLPWHLRPNEREYLFGASVRPRTWSRDRPGGFDAPLKQAVVVEPTVSCWQTTAKARMEQIARSEFARLETIGTTGRGRDMYLLRISDWDVPADDKKQLILIGPYHGNEPSGMETCLDLAAQLVSRPELRERLKQFEFYILPSHHPDGVASGSHQGRYKIDPGNHSYEDMAIPEAAVVAAMLRKYQPRFTDPFAIVFHQWGRDYTLISHMDTMARGESESWRLVRNMCIDVSNRLDIPMAPTYSHYTNDTFTGVRGMLAAELDIPNFTLENPILSSFSLALQMPLIQRELAICHATIDQLANPRDVAVKRRTTPKDLKFEPAQLFNVKSAAEAPVIDGKLGEACWQGDTTIDEFKPVTRPRRRDRDSEGPKPQDNRAWVAVDSENIYVAFRVEGLGDAKGDGVEVFLDTNLDRWSYFQFMVWADGNVGSAYYIAPAMRAEELDIADPEVAISAEDGTVEIAIPIKTLRDTKGLPEGAFIAPAAGKTLRWGANFVRMPHGDHPEMSWSKITNRYSHRPWEFNAIVFDKPQQP